MAKQLIAFGRSATDQVVKEWLTQHGIDPNDVLGYEITRSAFDTPTIKVTMFFEDPIKKEE